MRVRPLALQFTVFGVGRKNVETRPILQRQRNCKESCEAVLRAGVAVCGEVDDRKRAFKRFVKGLSSCREGLQTFDHPLLSQNREPPNRGRQSPLQEKL